MNDRKLFYVIFMIIILGAADLFAQGETTCRVAWNPISDPGVTEVLIYRSTTDVLTEYQQIAAVGVSSNLFTDTYANGFEPGAQYFYRLRSRNVVGAVSGFSGRLSAHYIQPSDPYDVMQRCMVTSVTAIDASTWRVEWSTQQLTRGRLEYWKMSTGAVTVSATDETLSTTHYIDITGLDLESIYFVRAISRDESLENMVVSCNHSFVTSDDGTPLEFVIDPEVLTVEEGGTGQFTVRLSSIPDGTVDARVQRLTGDSDLDVESGETLTFTSSDWYVEQTVTIAAYEDIDEEDGEAVIRISSVAGPEVVSFDLVAGEADNDKGDDDNGNLASAPVAIYPIPFQPASGNLTIGNLPENGRIGIYDLRGQKVYDDSWGATTTLVWNGENNSGVSVASGRYFVVITDSTGQSRKQVILVVN
ncbi:MAG: T9SS type A sorting domain-containing protein [Candidatus Krumholzibacteria bacterium]|nr:T9SS type A sorting domain-containing protein [Candidatus Krumholzibacteria bacterium]